MKKNKAVVISIFFLSVLVIACAVFVYALTEAPSKQTGDTDTKKAVVHTAGTSDSSVNTETEIEAQESDETDDDHDDREREDDDEYDEEDDEDDDHEPEIKNAPVTEDEAKSIAVNHLGGRVTDFEGDYHKGKAVYEVELKVDGEEVDVLVDPETGEIVDIEWD